MSKQYINWTDMTINRDTLQNALLLSLTGLMMAAIFFGFISKDPAASDKSFAFIGISFIVVFLIKKSDEESFLFFKFRSKQGVE